MLGLLIAATMTLSFREARVLPLPMSHMHVAFAHDEDYEYLATPGGLLRSRRFLNATEPVDPIAFAGQRVTDVLVDGANVYAMVGNGISVTSPQPSIWRSTDDGQTFTPLDRSLGRCSGADRCEYVVGRHIEVVNGRIFVEIGGNILVSADDGATWKALYGSMSNGVPDVQVCPVVFTVQIDPAGAWMHLGGECPLDEGWVGRGNLARDLLSWTTPPQRFHVDNLENRNAQFVRGVLNGLGGVDVYTGVEGGLLRGSTWVIRYALRDVRYPYICELLASSRWAYGLLLAAGFDKQNEMGYLAMSTDRGANWIDVTNYLPLGSEAVVLLTEDSENHLMIGVQRNGQLIISEITAFPSTPKRRAVR